VNAAEIVDLVDVPVALTRTNGVIHGVIKATDVDAVSGADTGTELTANALFHAIFVPIEHVTSVLTWLLGTLLLGIARRHRRPSDMKQRELEAAEEIEGIRHY
jgi:hypothetical protein